MVIILKRAKFKIFFNLQFSVKYKLEKNIYIIDILNNNSMKLIRELVHVNYSFKISKKMNKKHYY